MSGLALSLIDLEADSGVCLEAEDYETRPGKWCAGCGDFGALNAVKRLLAKEQLQPEKMAFVSGIGCSSRFPHYVNAYGFHGIHGRALPIATGLKLARPELDVFVVMGDGDCTSIGAGHWIHATRYNANMVVLLLDNNIYGLTKNQTSPTTPPVVVIQLWRAARWYLPASCVCDFTPMTTLWNFTSAVWNGRSNWTIPTGFASAYNWRISA